MECLSEKHRKVCNCTYDPCPRKYKCSECLHYRRKSWELPACFFNREFEGTYDRSAANFIRMHKQ